MRRAINGLLGLFGCRIVSARWGPRGFRDSFQRIKTQGVYPRRIVDIGASTGVWTRECMTVFPDSTYLLIDPLEENAEALARLAEDRRVRVWRGAAGTSEGELPFYRHGDQSSFLPSEFGTRAETTVAVRPLDSFLGHELDGPPDLIKLDVQGYEIEALKGAEECLRSAELILVEVSYRRVYERGPLAHEVIAHLGSRGFRIYDICTYSVRPYDGEVAQSDLVFAHERSTLFRYEHWS